MKFLITTHDTQAIELLTYIAHQDGHDVTVCHNTTAAWQACQQDFYPLVIVDIEKESSAEMDSLQLCRQICTLSAEKNVVILLLAEPAQLENLKAIFEAGINDYFTKPLNPQQVRMRLEIVKQHGRERFERWQAEESLRESEEKFRTLLEYAPEGIIIVDKEGRIVLVNAMSEEMFGYTRAEMLGQNIEILLPERLRPRHANHRHAFLAHPKNRQMGQSLDLLARRKFGTVFPVEVGLSVANTKNGILIIAHVINITERKQTEEKANRQGELLYGVARAMNYLLVTPNFSVAIEEVLKYLGLSTNVSRVYLFENHFHPQTNEPLMSLRFEWTLDESHAQINHLALQNASYSPSFSRWYETLRNEKTIQGSVRQLPLLERQPLEVRKVKTIFIAPIMILGRFWGFIGFEDDQFERQWRMPIGT